MRRPRFRTNASSWPSRPSRGTAPLLPARRIKVEPAMDDETEHMRCSIPSFRSCSDPRRHSGPQLSYFLLLTVHAISRAVQVFSVPGAPWKMVLRLQERVRTGVEMLNRPMRGFRCGLNRCSALLSACLPSAFGACSRTDLSSGWPKRCRHSCTNRLVEKISAHKWQKGSRWSTGAGHRPRVGPRPCLKLF